MAQGTVTSSTGLARSMFRSRLVPPSFVITTPLFRGRYSGEEDSYFLGDCRFESCRNFGSRYRGIQYLSSFVPCKMFKGRFNSCLELKPERANQRKYTLKSA